VQVATNARWGAVVFWVYFGTSAQAIMIGWSNESTRVDLSIGWSASRGGTNEFFKSDIGRKKSCTEHIIQEESNCFRNN
jgi:hypothetical protein